MSFKENVTHFFATGFSLFFAAGCGLTAAAALFPLVPVWGAASVFLCSGYMNWRWTSQQLPKTMNDLFSWPWDFYHHFFEYSEHPQANKSPEEWSPEVRPADWPEQSEGKNDNWYKRPVSTQRQMVIGLGLITSMTIYFIFATLIYHTLIANLSVFVFLAPFASFFPTLAMIFILISGFAFASTTFSQISKFVLSKSDERLLGILKETHKKGGWITLLLQAIIFAVTLFGVFMTTYEHKNSLDKRFAGAISLSIIVACTIIDFVFYIEPMLKIPKILGQMVLNVFDNLQKMLFLQGWKNGHDLWSWFFYRLIQGASIVIAGFIALRNIDFSFTEITAGISEIINAISIALWGEQRQKINVDEFVAEGAPLKNEKIGHIAYVGYVACTVLLFCATPLIVKVFAAVGVLGGIADFFHFCKESCATAEASYPRSPISTNHPPKIELASELPITLIPQEVNADPSASRVNGFTT